MGVTGNEGDKFGDFEVSETNIERSENKASEKRGHHKFPMMLHKPGRLTKEVGVFNAARDPKVEAANEKALQAALDAGWYADVRDVPVDADGDGVPDAISEMTVDQARAALKGVVSAEQLAAYEADEQSHGNREPVINLLNDAKDRLEAKAAKAPKAAKADKSAKAAKAPKA